MTKRHFEVRAVWDDEARVYFSESDIIGLHIEAETLDEFERLVNEEAAELIVANHYSAEDMASRPLRDLIPALIWKAPLSRPA
jgi:EAL domain-containing protein (putative c-di-GMP-specific phosphodiesterase class I)